MANKKDDKKKAGANPKPSPRKGVQTRPKGKVAPEDDAVDEAAADEAEEEPHAEETQPTSPLPEEDEAEGDQEQSGTSTLASPEAPGSTMAVSASGDAALHESEDNDFPDAKPKRKPVPPVDLTRLATDEDD